MAILKLTIKSTHELWEVVKSIKLQGFDINELSVNERDLTISIPTSLSAIVKCPECLTIVSQDELDMFGGLCEACSGY